MERLYLTQKHRSVLLKNHPFIVWFWELESDFLSCQLLVDISKGVCLVFNIGLLGLVQMNLKETRSIKPDLDSLSKSQLGRRGRPRCCYGRPRGYGILASSASACWPSWWVWEESFSGRRKPHAFH